MLENWLNLSLNFKIEIYKKREGREFLVCSKSVEEKLRVFPWGPVILREVGGQTGRKKGEQIGRKEREGGREGRRGMRLAFDTACQRPEGWSGSRQPDRRIISGIRSKTLLGTLLQTENTRQKGLAAPCVERDTSQDAVYQKRFHLLSSFYL